MREKSDSEGKYEDLLHQFEGILEFDPLVDEVGFIAPCQFAMLNEEPNSSERSAIDVLDSNDNNFLLRDHKLGISTQILLPLYKAARNAFMAAIREYKKYNNRSQISDIENWTADTAESEVLKHSKALVLLSCDFGTAWNSRKLIISKKNRLPTYMDELILSALILSYSPKSERAWNHRRWVIKLIAERRIPLPEILGKESELVERMAEKSKMNYRAWNHRCWLVSYMSREQMLNELKKNRGWAGLHAADSSCFHYRRQLMLRILEDSTYIQGNTSSLPSLEAYQLWKEELDWDEMLIKRYVGREALWLHRRFLSLCWTKHFASDPIGINNDLCFFMDYEFDLVNSCLIIRDDDFEDFQQQAIHSATYLLWLTKQLPVPWMIKGQETMRTSNLISILNKECPERCSLWDSLTEPSENYAREIL